MFKCRYEVSNIMDKVDVDIFLLTRDVEPF